MMIFTTYIRGIAVDTGKVLFTWRRAGGVDSRSHVTPCSAKAFTETMFAPIMRTSRNYGATGMIRSWAFRMPIFKVPFLVAFDVPHVPMMRTSPSVNLIIFLEMRDSVHTMWLDGAESMYTVVLPMTCEFNFSA